MEASQRRFVRQSIRVTAGLVIWFAHLTAVYAWTAVACARQLGATTIDGIGLVPSVIGMLTVLALAATAAITIAALRRPRGADPDRFFDRLTALTGGLSLVAIGWTALPAILAPGCEI
ncbi:MAG: hypothetical protein AB7V27_01395 [Candidatus Binatia bacterium]